MLQFAKLSGRDCDESQQLVNMLRVQITLEQDMQGQIGCVDQGAAMCLAAVFNMHLYVVLCI